MRDMSDILRVRDAQRELYRAFNALANELDDHQSKLDKAKLSFSTTGAAGGIMTIVGLALIPVTLGASLGVAIAGGVIGGLSAVGNIGSLVADKILTDKTMEEARNALAVLSDENKSLLEHIPRVLAQLDGEELKDLKKKMKRHKDIHQDIKDILIGHIKSAMNYLLNGPITSAANFGRSASSLIENIIRWSIELSKSVNVRMALGGVGAGAGAAAYATKAGKAVMTSADAVVDVAKATGKVGLSSAKVAGIAMSGVGLAIDVGGIMYYSMKVHKKKPCEVAQTIRKAVEFLHITKETENGKTVAVKN